MPLTRVNKCLSRENNALLAENALISEFRPVFRLQYSSTPSHQPPPEIAHTNNSDFTGDKKDAENNPVE